MAKINGYKHGAWSYNKNSFEPIMADSILDSAGQCNTVQMRADKEFCWLMKMVKKDKLILFIQTGIQISVDQLQIEYLEN